MYHMKRQLDKKEDVCGPVMRQLARMYDQIKQLSLRHQAIISVNEMMNEWIDEWSVDICGKCVQLPKTSPMTFWTQNTMSSTTWVTVCSIRAFFRCLHSNTWTPEACITYFTVTQAFYIWISSISTQMVCWKSFCWAECSFWTRLTFVTASGCIRASWTLYRLCFVWTTEITGQEIRQLIERLLL